LKMVIFNWLKGYFSHPQKILFQASSHLPQQLKFTTSDSCDRIKDEFQLLQAQYHSLKLECDKLASEKSEMQRHYVMYYEMSYGLNIEMHKQLHPADFFILVLIYIFFN
uniref:TLE family member 5, transcriptional modulator n=1 Tax=Naja naja TaxID=35670 RepID=A0A8C6V5P3_NAJNA